MTTQNSLFEITGNDIAQLRDDNLRSLIGLLCEADYRSAGLSTRGITWGGHQDAADGGLDVVVRNEVEPPSNSFVPKRHTGFQVKKPDMPRAKILEEMRPNGVLRDSIKELVKAGGAYLIISSKVSTTDKILKNRIDAMREAVKDEENSDNLHVDFLDQGQVANWVRNHPALILWVRNKIGRTLQGWRPYENWANAPGGIEEEYLLDDGLRLYDGTGSNSGILSVQDGLLRLRSKLSTLRSSVRLVGLSGVGKTRLVQALFDDRTGEQPLASSLAIYTDISDSPSPEPGAMAEQLVALQSKTILIVDNCPPDLHRRLTKTCTQTNSTVSLLTIEYDVRDDLPEETSVFKLEPASKEVISTLIQKRFPHISQVDSQSIAKFSGGNASIALALANTVQRGESLSGFRDNELFERLFWQTDRQKNEKLLRSAEACSLIYSFEGTDTTSEQSELQFLASLTDTSATVLYSDVAELKGRELVQSRNKWRAVMPQAIANRLAKSALAAIPKDVLVQKFQSTSERLIKSFTRRLGYLHDSEEAVEIVEEWLEPDGWIGQHVSNLNDFGMEVFVNIAPVSLAKTLAAIEQAAQETEEVFAQHQSRFFDLLQKLAYEPELFERCARLLCRVALFEWKNEASNSHQYSDILRSLFYLYFSGTHAQIEDRVTIIKELTCSKEQHSQELGLYLLRAALEAEYFGPVRTFNFGARRRDYGYCPRTHKDIVRWFEPVIDVCVQLALSKQSTGDNVRKLLAYNFEALWIKEELFDLLKKASERIHTQKPWHEGWVEVLDLVDKQLKSGTEESVHKLCALEKYLRPSNLLELARACLSSNCNDHSSNEEARDLGVQVARCPETLDNILNELVSEYGGSVTASYFCKGLAYGCGDRIELFQKMRAKLATIAPEKRQSLIFEGFLGACAEYDIAVYNKLLDGIVQDDLLGEWFAVLQTRYIIDQQGIKRLHQALDTGKARIEEFKWLAYERKHESIGDNDLAELLKKILSKKNGLDVVLEILKMRFHERKQDYSEELLKITRDVLCHYLLETDNGRAVTDYDDHSLECIARVGLDRVDGIEAAKGIIKDFAKKIFERRISHSKFPYFLNILAKKYPEFFLDFFLGDDRVEEYKRTNLFSIYHNTPISQISDEVILSWCSIAPDQRYPLAASVVNCLEETKQLKWKPIVYAILEQAPDIEAVLNRFANAIYPVSWVGSRADVLEERATLLQEFYTHPNELVRKWAKNQYEDLQKKIKYARKSEQEREEQFRRQDERFE